MQYPLDLWVKVDGSYERLDTFKDENLTIKDSIKDFNDIKKIFTSLSRSFTIPASKKNNKALGHFYRGDVIDVDVRALIDAKITLNSADHKYGNISLESAKLKDGEPYSYTVRFYGNLSEIQKNIGEDNLSTLNLSDYNIANPDFKNLFHTTSSSVDRDVCFPLMSKNRRFIVDEANSDAAQTLGLQNTANIHFSTNARTAGFYGVIVEDLVGAIKTGLILDAIEDKYDLTFSGVLKDAAYVRDLRLLMHKSKSQKLDDSYSVAFTGFSNNVTDKNMSTVYPDDGYSISSDSNGITTGKVLSGYFPIKSPYVKRETTSDISLTISTTSTKFKVNVRENGEIVSTFDNAGTYSVDLTKRNANNSIYTFDAEVYGTTSISIDVDFNVNSFFKNASGVSDDTVTHSISSTLSTVGASGDTYLISEHIPQIKITDFLSELFKRFNLVATVDEDLNIDTKHYDYYVNQGTTRDITKYIDVSEYDVKKPTLYSGIKFTTEDVQTIGEYGFQKVNGRKYGELNFEIDLGDDRLSGGLYEVNLKSKMIPLDQPYDLDSGLAAFQTSMLLVDNSLSELTLKPTFLYTSIQVGRRVAWDNGSSVEYLNSYIYQPSEVYHTNEVRYNGDVAVVGNYFAAEESVIDFRKGYPDLSLFNCFYSNTISTIFDQSSRRVSYKAYLPMKELIDLSPADILVIRENYHLIESFETNYLTGVTSLNLIMLDARNLSRFETSTVNINESGSTTDVNYLDANTGLITLNTNVSTGSSSARDVIGGENGVIRVKNEYS